MQYMFHYPRGSKDPPKDGGDWLHEHGALQIAKEFDNKILAAFHPVFRYARVTEPTTEYQCHHCPDVVLSTTSGPIEVRMHAASCHKDLGGAAGADLFHCEPYAIVFLSRDYALAHWKTCRYIQAMAAAGITVSIPPFSALIAKRKIKRMAPQSTVMDDYSLSYREYQAWEGYFIRVQNGSHVELQGLAVMSIGFPSRAYVNGERYPLGPKFLQENPLTGIDLFVHTRVNLLANKWVSFQDAKDFAEEFGFSKGLKDLWDIVGAPTVDAL